MTGLIHKRLAFCSFTAAVVGASLCLAGSAGAQSKKESTKIQPYTGDPIFLDEVEQIAKPTLTRREKVTEPYKDGKVRIEREIAHFSDNHFEADGVYREFYPNGQLFAEGKYARGRQHGEWTYYYENGQLNRKAAYKDGKPDGPREIYRADGVELSPQAARRLALFEEGGYGRLPICIAKTQYSFSADPTLVGAPTGYMLPVREVRLSAGAGFVVAVAGEMMTMPGLPRHPASEHIGLGPNGEIVGLH